MQLMKITPYTEGTGYLTIIDSKGNKTSGKNLDSKMSHGYRVYRINDNLIISGLTPGAEDYALMKTDLSGVQVWVKTYGGENMDHCFAMDIVMIIQFIYLDISREFKTGIHIL